MAADIPVTSKDADLPQEEFDVIVIGYGAAGASAAIAASDEGARVLLLEKGHHLGGTSLLSSGFMRVAKDPSEASKYLRRTLGDRVETTVVESFALQMVQLPDYLAHLAKPLNATVSVKFRPELAEHEVSDLYDWPGSKTLGWAGVDAVPGFHGYPWASASKGHMLMKVLEEAIQLRPITVRLGHAATELLTTSGRVAGITLRTERCVETVHAKSLVLASGGFEFDPVMLSDNLSVPEIRAIGHPLNTGDGIRLASQAGAALWHMWHVHASYGFRPQGHPLPIRNHLGGARRTGRPVTWIIVDKHGDRFMNEAPPAPQDTPWRSLGQFDVETGCFDRIPAWLIFDEIGRRTGPIGKAAWNLERNRYEWSIDNSAEIARGWIHSADTIAALASKIHVDPDRLTTTISKWDDAVRTGRDWLGRPKPTMASLDHPPYYAIETWPVLSNTQGGPKHDHQQQVLDTNGRAIPGLYVAGELGSIFGHIYMLGGNLTEATMGGRTAGTNAARTALREHHQPKPSSHKAHR